MARDFYNSTVTIPGDSDEAILLVGDVMVTVYDRGTLDESTIYAAATGLTEISNPFEAVNGQVQFWADAGRYDIKYHDTQIPTRISDQTIGWESVPAGEQGIPGSFIDYNDDASRRGKSIVDTAETISSVGYSLLTTPDRVSNIVLPEDGFLVVLFSAVWWESVNDAARASIFIGANQLKVNKQGTGQVIQEAGIEGNPNIETALTSYPGGLRGSLGSNASGDFTPEITTGQAIAIVQSDEAQNTEAMGGPCYIFAAAGTYNISVQYKVSSGNVTVRDRKLWVEARI
jgi:hypothetical protein